MGIVQIVNSIFSSNTYILSHTDSCRVWLIDIGDIEPVIARLLPGQQIQGVFLTHTHFDHFYGINRLISLFPDCIVYTSAHGQEGLYSEKLNFSKYHNHPFVFSGNKVRYCMRETGLKFSGDKSSKYLKHQAMIPDV